MNTNPKEETERIAKKEDQNSLLNGTLLFSSMVLFI